MNKKLLSPKLAMRQRLKIIFLWFNFGLLRIRLVFLKPKLVFTGDSHAYFQSKNHKVMKKFSVNKSNILTIWLGPQLLYQISRDGFLVDKEMAIVLKLVKNVRFIVIILGEIDCRVHLVPKTLMLGDKEFFRIALAYKKAVTQFITDYGFEKAIIIAPYPPSELGVDNPRFPRNGLISERVLVTKKITKCLAEISSKSFIVVENSRELSTQNGSLDRNYTDDGVHLNSQAIDLIQDKINLILRDLI
jgi:hypothetical protein